MATYSDKAKAKKYLEKALELRYSLFGTEHQGIHLFHIIAY